MELREVLIELPGLTLELFGESFESTSFENLVDNPKKLLRGTSLDS